MRTDEFDYDLPDEAIASVGAEPRDSARLLVDHSGGIDHRRVADLPQLVGPDDVVVLNETRVLPARLRFTRSTGGRGEILLVEPVDADRWEVLARPSSRLPRGTVVELGPDLSVELGEDLGEGRRVARLVTEDLHASLRRHGEVPLPPYLGEVSLADPERYQTVYAARAASVAAPTAGLHLTSALLDAIRARGAGIEHLELVVGPGTFRPMTGEDVDDHVMHSESYRIDEEAWARITDGRRVLAVGTTVVRALEAAASSGRLTGRTDLFIRRPYPWKVVDRLMTNFHLPRSSLLVLVDAFVGSRWRDLYAAALASGYRFLSFGDAMLVERSR